MNNKYSYKTFAIVLISLIVAVYTFIQANDEIIIHWDINGNADGYAPKEIILMLPFMIPLVDCLIVWISNMDPRKNNMQKSASGIQVVRFIVAAILFVCTLLTCIETLYPKTLNIEVIVPCFVGIMIMIIGNILPKIRSNYTIGIRNPWTLHSDIVWQKTQRFSGRLWFVCGIAICLFSVTPYFSHLVMLVMIFFIIILPNLYAYYLYQKMRKENNYDRN